MKRSFVGLVFFSLLALVSDYALALSPQDMAMGALKGLNSTDSSTIQSTLGVSGGSKGNAGKGDGGLNITRTLSGSIPCPSSFTEFGEGSVGGVSFKCQQNANGRNLSYCLNSLNGVICTDSDFKVLSGSSKTEGETTITVTSCDIKSCNVQISTHRNKVYSGNDLDRQGKDTLNSSYSNSNSVASMTLGAGVYDQDGNAVFAGKNPNMGKYQETLLNKQSIIDCSTRQFKETESNGKTSLCSNPNQIVNIFDKDSSGCKTIKTCINSVTSTKTHDTSCTMAVNTTKITEHDTIPHHTCTRQVAYHKQCHTNVSVNVTKNKSSGGIRCTSRYNNKWAWISSRYVCSAIGVGRSHCAKVGLYCYSSGQYYFGHVDRRVGSGGKEIKKDFPSLKNMRAEFLGRNAWNKKFPTFSYSSGRYRGDSDYRFYHISHLLSNYPEIFVGYPTFFGYFFEYDKIKDKLSILDGMFHAGFDRGVFANLIYSFNYEPQTSVSISTSTSTTCSYAQ